MNGAVVAAAAVAVGGSCEDSYHTSEGCDCNSCDGGGGVSFGGGNGLVGDCLSNGRFLHSRRHLAYSGVRACWNGELEPALSFAWPGSPALAAAVDKAGQD